jgi:hypothetical protein
VAPSIGFGVKSLAVGVITVSASVSAPSVTTGALSLSPGVISCSAVTISPYSANGYSSWSMVAASGFVPGFRAVGSYVPEGES